MRRTHPVREHQREPACSRLVDRDSPCLPLREQREHVREHVGLDDPLPRRVADQCDTNVQPSAQSLESGPLGTLAREDEQETGIAGVGNRAHQQVETLLPCEPSDREDDDVLGAGSHRLSQLRPPCCQSGGPLPELLHVDRVREDPNSVGTGTARRHRPRGERSDRENPRRPANDGRNDSALDSPSPARPRPFVVALHDERVGNPPRPTPGDRPLGGERAPAGDDDDLGPSPLEGAGHAGSDRVVVMENALRTGDPYAAQVDRTMARLDGPRPPCNGGSGVDHRQVHLVTSADPIEERGSIRRRLREHGGHPNRTGTLPGRVELGEPGIDVTLNRAARAPSSQAVDREVARHGRVEPQRLRQHGCTPGATCGSGRSCETACRGLPDAGVSVPLERVHEGHEGLGRVLELLGGNRLEAADPPGELRLRTRELWSHAPDLAQCDSFLELALEQSAALGSLTRVDAIEDERFRKVVALGDRQQPRPEVVVLALLEPDVVAKPVPLENVSVDENRRVEVRRAEERRPAHLGEPAWHLVETADATVIVDVQHRAAENRDLGMRSHVRELPLEPVRHGDVVRVKACDVATASVVECRD